MSPSDDPKPTSGPGADVSNKEELAELVRGFEKLFPQFAELTIKKSEHDATRHRTSLRYWGFPFLVSMTLLGGGVLWLAGIALSRDKPEVAQTIVGYLMTYLGGIGTGQAIKSKTQ
jgi:hypothetical protein